MKQSQGIIRFIKYNKIVTENIKIFHIKTHKSQLN
jgi:hypothetical protein